MGKPTLVNLTPAYQPEKDLIVPIFLWVLKQMWIKLLLQVIYFDYAQNTLFDDVIYAVKSILIDHSDFVMGHK